MSRVDNIINGVRKSGTKKKKSRVESIIEASSNGNINTGVNQKYVDTFINDANNFFATAEQDRQAVGWANASSSYDSRHDAWWDLYTRANTIGAWLKINRDRIDKETYNSLNKTLNDVRSHGSSVVDTFKGAKDYYAQWDSEDSYNSWYESYKKSEEERNAVLGAEDFDEYYRIGKTDDDNNDFIMEIFGNPVGESNYIEHYRKFYADAPFKEGSYGGGQVGKNASYALAMTEDEVKIYDYYLGKYGKDRAEEYLDSIKETLNQRVGSGIYKTVEGNKFLETTFALSAGLDQFISGVGNLDNLIMGTEADPTSATQYASSMIREDLDGGWKVAYDLINTTSNMLPSILVGSMTGGLGGALTLGTSAVGNGYAEMRRLGYDEWQSRGYGLLVGASETALQYALGGISKLGGKVTGNAVSKFVSKFDNAIARTAIKLGGNMASEGLEEAVQTVLEPAFKALMTGEDFESPEWEDVWYSALLGALSAGMLEGVPTIAGTTYNSYKANKVYGADAQALVTESLDIDPENAHAQRMQERLDNGKNVSGYQLNRLVGANENTLVSQDKAKMKSAVETRLTELGEQSDVGKLAEVLVKQASGEKLSLSEKNLIKNSKYGQRVSNELSPSNIETGEYTSKWAEGIGTERINTDAYNKALYDLASEQAGVTVEEEKPSVTVNTASKEIATESEFKASEDGKTKLGDTEVSIKEIASVKDGEITLRLEDGSTVKASDVEFSSNEEGLLYENVVHMGLNAATANAFINGYDGNMPVAEYAADFRRAYRYGELGIPTSEMNTEGYSSRLSESQKSLAYNLGKTDAKYKVEKNQSEKEKIASTDTINTEKNASKGEKKGKLHNTLKPTNETQQASLKALGVLAEALNIDIYTFESPTDAKGRRLGENGSYDPRTKTLRIDLYAGADGKGTMLFTAAHELTHHIREKLPVKFKAFADFLFEQYGEKGISVSELIAKKKAFLEEKGRITPDMTEAQAYDLAYEEVVADACESFLADGDAVAKIAELKAKDKTLWQTIKDFITKLVARIKAAYEGLSPDSVEGRLVAEMLDSAEKLKAMWTEMLVETSEVSADSVNITKGEVEKTFGLIWDQLKESKEFSKYKNIKDFLKNETDYETIDYMWGYFDVVEEDIPLFDKLGTEDLLLGSLVEAYQKGTLNDPTTYREVIDENSGMFTIDMETESAYPFFSERTWTASEYVTEREKTAKAISKSLNVDINTAYKYIDDINGVARLIADDRARLDYEPNLDEKATVLKPNSEYKFSVDMSTLCAKRLLFTGTFDAIQRALPNMVFDSEDIVSLREMMQKRGYEVACGICYVESTRREIGKITQDFINSYKESQKTGKPITRINSEGKLVDLKKTKEQKETTADKTTDKFYAEKGYTPTLADLNTTDIDLVKRDHPLVYEAYLNFMNARGQAKPKLLETRAEYKGEILKHFKYTSAVNARNNAGGLRLQSFSDFEVPHLIDMMQIVMDMSRVGLKSQAYTKVPAFAEVFGNSGVKINLSLIAKGDGLDANGNLVFDDVEGINHKEAFKLRDKYSKNVGTILVGKTDAHIIAAMADPRIDYIIPFHKSSWKESLYDALGLTGYADYTDFQNEKPIDKDRKIKNFDPSEYWDFTKSGDENAQIYLAKCREEGRIPKFPQFQGYPGYWKLLIDFKMYDNDGVGSPQEVVKPIFNTEASERILREYKGGHRNFPVAKDVVEDFVKEHGDNFEIVIFDSNQAKLTTNKNPSKSKDIRYSFRSYTDKQKENWKNAKRIVLYDNEMQFKKFISDARYDKDFNKKIYFGAISSDLAKLIKAETGINVENFNCSLSAYEIKKIFKDHGDEEKEAPRGQRAITEGDIIEIPNVIQSPENIKLSPKKYEGKPVIEFSKQTNGKLTVAAVVSDKHLDLFVQTAYAGIKKGNLATPIGEQAPINTLEASSGTVSDDSIAQTPNFVNTPDENLYSERNPDSVSNRSLLANALESVAQNDVERTKLNEYKSKIALIESEQTKLADLRAKIKELSFAKGKRDVDTIKSLQFEANQTANRINTYDRQLLNLESTKALKGVLEREKQMAYKRAETKGKEALAKQREKDAKTQRELLTRYQESRKKGIESRHKTEMRHKIKDVVNELNQYLLKGTKDKHVPIELQKAVAEALDAVNMDTVGAEERIAKKREEMMRAKTPEAIEKLAKEIERIQEMGGNMANKISRLKTAYDSIINSDDPLIANSHDEVIANTIDKVIEVVGNTPLRDMSLYQLEAVHDMYRMILHSIRTANKAFKAEKGLEISVLANTVIADLDGKTRNRLNVADTKFAWNNLKPVYAFERIGSNTFTKLFNAVREGEDVWARDMSEAQAFRKEQSKIHKFDSWDFEKKYSFETQSGKSFELDLGEMMSIYAFAKDEHSKGHLIGEGFVFDPKKEVVENVKGKIKVKVNLEDATAYNLSEQIVADIIGKLTPDQKAFADAMQDYLSTTMGEKGNEVSLELYEIKLFKNKNYFPLKVAPQYMAIAKEKAQGDVKIKNKGFTKDRKEGAKNPIVLSSFMDVWATHVNEMSMYHAFTLPLEDFYRVFNYKTPRMEGYAPMSVNASIQNAYGEAATSYIEQLLKDLNGGARVDPTAGIINKLTGLFKKSAVFASASVVVQQPSAIARATALVDTKYFVGKPSGKHKETWAEIKKYAPVAIIKEMGYFDTGMGKSSEEWLKGDKTLKDKIDDVASKAPALADELAWGAIWKAVKRETLHTHKDLKPNSDEFLKAVGERFTEVITKTQVYDSVLSRSANMRSKDTGMKMATAFLGEPTTSINMIQDALTQGKRGDKRYARKAIGSVVASMILNSILVSFVYAGRDDDEDKTYAEKYVGTLTEELLDSLNPLTLIPFVKDIVSIVQGYDVERSDMAVITDVIKAWNNLDSDNRSVYRKVEDFAGAIASIFGLPVKNIMRDARGMYNTVNSFINGEQTTGAGIGNAISEAVTGDEKSNGQQLYEAMLSGDSAQIERVKGRFKEQNAINSAIRKALRDNDPRIKQAAEARYNGDIAEYMRIAKEIIAEGHFKQDDVVAAINSEISALKKGEGTTESASSDKATSIYKMDDYYAALVGRDQATAYAVKEDLIKTDVANGKDRDEAEADFNSRFASYLRELYEVGELSDSEAQNMLVQYGGKSKEDAYSKVQYWEFKQMYPDYDLSEEAVTKYYNEVEPSGIDVGIYYDYYKQRSKCKGTDSDGDGKTDSGSVKSEVLYVIDSLPITNSQKDVLYYLNGWSAKTIYEAPWH